MSLIGILGVLFGAMGVIIGLYSRYKQRELEKRIERKEDLKDVVESLDKVIEWMEDFQEGLSSPKNDIAAWVELEDFCKDVLGYHHLSNNTVTISISVFQFVEGGERKPINDEEIAVNLYDKNDSPTISIEIEDVEGYSEETCFMHLDMYFRGAGKFKFQKGSLKREHEELIEEFCAGLLSDIDSQITTILENCIREALKNEPSLEVDPDNYKNLEGIAFDIYETAIRYDGIKGDLDDLDDLIDDLKKTRQSALQTSYS